MTTRQHIRATRQLHNIAIFGKGTRNPGYIIRSKPTWLKCAPDTGAKLSEIDPAMFDFAGGLTLGFSIHRCGDKDVLAAIALGHLLCRPVPILGRGTGLKDGRMAFTMPLDLINDAKVDPPLANLINPNHR